MDQLAHLRLPFSSLFAAALAAWMLRRLAELHGYKNAKPDACYEWKSRVNRHFRPMQLAAYAVRDALLCHAWHYELIPLPGFTEMANSYYDTIWGYAMFSRWPLAYPHPVFNGCETLTRLLDGATCTRVLPTGSKTVYALEFKRPAGDRLYALWTARGETDATIFLGKNAIYTRIGLLGEETAGLRDARLVVSDEPVYVVTEKPIDGVAVAMSRRYPHEETPMAEKAPVAVPLAKAAEVIAVTDLDRRIEHKWDNPPEISRFTRGKPSCARSSTTNAAPASSSS